MLPQWIIEKKRDGEVLTPSEINLLIKGYVDGTIPDYQLSAFAMAVYFRGMTYEEIESLTKAMLSTGEQLPISDIKGHKIDKHSTGGIGDKLSLIVAPLAASFGVILPMIAGRGLGITGGTLDKLESIPGFKTQISLERLSSILEKVGCFIIGQSEEVVPADRKLYALRDVTGTVPSIPLITSSILSKKLAEGLDGLVMDVKVGSGAFMQRLEDARLLAETLIEVGTRAGLKVRALITDMNQPLGRAVGNSVEVIEAIEVLKGGGPYDVMELSIKLVREMLELAAIPDKEKIEDNLNNGKALEIFQKMIKAQGGNPEIVENYDLLPKAAFIMPIRAERGGIVQYVNAELLGKTSLLLGAGRRKVDDKIDHGAGITDIKQAGEEVSEGEPLALLHCNNRNVLESAKELIKHAFVIGDNIPCQRKLVIEEL